MRAREFHMKLEIGGGIPIKARGEGWVNIDLVDNADIRHDLNVFPWPIQDGSIEEVYSSHCLEHLRNPVTVLQEIARICTVGAAVEIRVPHPISDLAVLFHHCHVFGPIAALNMEHHFPREYWLGPKRLQLKGIGYGPSILLGEARRELPFLANLSDEVVMKWIPRTCHECRFYYTVIVNEFYAE